jgi:phosphoribosylformylglycinamidine cyclo-ligase
VSRSSRPAAGVDADDAARGLGRLVERITRSWPRPGDFGAVQLPTGYFANVIDIGGTGLALCTDGVGSKAMLAQAMNYDDTIGIDCVAVSVKPPQAGSMDRVVTANRAAVAQARHGH